VIRCRVTPSLLHLSGVTEFEIDVSHFYELKTMEEQARTSGDYSRYRVAAITRNVSDDANIKLYHAMIKEAEIDYQDFDTIEEALEWLGRAEAVDAVRLLFKELK